MTKSEIAKKYPRFLLYKKYKTLKASLSLAFAFRYADGQPNFWQSLAFGRVAYRVKHHVYVSSENPTYRSVMVAIMDVS